MKKQVQKKAAPRKRRAIITVKKTVHAQDNGWDSPPAQLPRFGEIAMGIVYDPQRNTR